jgi:hypothetical protein
VGTTERFLQSIARLLTNSTQVSCNMPPRSRRGTEHRFAKAAWDLATIYAAESRRLRSSAVSTLGGRFLRRTSCCLQLSTSRQLLLSELSILLVCLDSGRLGHRIVGRCQMELMCLRIVVKCKSSVVARQVTQNPTLQAGSLNLCSVPSRFRCRTGRCTTLFGVVGRAQLHRANCRIFHLLLSWQRQQASLWDRIQGKRLYLRLQGNPMLPILCASEMMGPGLIVRESWRGTSGHKRATGLHPLCLESF